MQGGAPPGSGETYFSPSATDTPFAVLRPCKMKTSDASLGAHYCMCFRRPRVMAGGGAALGAGAIACPPCPLSSRLPGSARQRTNFRKNVNDSLYCFRAALWSIPASPGSAPARPCVHRWSSSHYRTARCCVPVATHRHTPGVCMDCLVCRPGCKHGLCLQSRWWRQQGHGS